MALLLTICHPRVARRKYTPDTACQPEPREVCGPDGFQMVAGPVQCYNQTKTIVVDTPVEECELEPQQTCTQATKLLPALQPVQQCVGVPQVLILYPGTLMILYPVTQEVCGVSTMLPIKKTRPSIKKWCYDPPAQGVIKCSKKFSHYTQYLGPLCGSSVYQNNSYIESPSYPNPSPSGICSFNIGKSQPNICQYK